MGALRDAQAKTRGVLSIKQDERQKKGLSEVSLYQSSGAGRCIDQGPTPLAKKIGPGMELFRPRSCTTVT